MNWPLTGTWCAVRAGIDGLWLALGLGVLLAAALLHRLLGVHEDDVMADYLLTNVAGNQKRRIEAAGDSIRQRYGSQITDEAIETLMGVDAVYLEAATRSINDQYGSTQRYAEEVLGVDAARREALRQRLVV